MFDNDGASTHLGVVLAANGPGTMTISMRITATMPNGQDITHGGFAFTLADTAFALACNGYGITTVASGGSITFVTSTAVVHPPQADCSSGRSGKHADSGPRIGE